MIYSRYDFPWPAIFTYFQYVSLGHGPKTMNAPPSPPHLTSPAIIKSTALLLPGTRDSSPHDAARPLRAIDLHSTAHAQANARVPKQRRVRFRIDAEVEVEVRAVLVRPRQAGLRAQRVAGRRAQVGDHDDNAVACVAECVA